VPDRVADAIDASALEHGLTRNAFTQLALLHELARPLNDETAGGQPTVSDNSSEDALNAQLTA
jgi:hypothetical protein